MNSVFLGPPGAGKGTQGKKVAERNKVVHISTGDILRQAIKNKTEVGLKANKYVVSGKLVPDDIVVEIVVERLKKDDCKNGFLLDGFPRNLNQAKELNSNLIKLSSSLNREVGINKVFYFDVDKDVLIKRLSGRRTCKSCGENFHVEFQPPKVQGKCDFCDGDLYQRKDDSTETIEKRLKVYHEQTKDLIDFYEKEGTLIKINGNAGVDEIFEQLNNFFNEYNNKVSS